MGKGAFNLNLNYPLLIASLECGPQLDLPPCHQVGSGPPPVLVPLPALGFDLLVAGSIALGGAACCVLPMSSAGLKNPLSSLLLAAVLLDPVGAQLLRAKLAAWQPGWLPGLAAWLAGWLGWLAGRLAGWLAWRRVLRAAQGSVP